MKFNESIKKVFRVSAVETQQDGFTLIEVMVAMVVLVVGVLGVLYMQLATVKGNSNAIGISRAVHASTAGLDMLENLDFSDDTDWPTANTLTAGTGKTITTLFNDTNIEGSVTQGGTLLYNVVDLNAADLRNEFGNKPTAYFPGAVAKKVTVTSTQFVSGQSRTVVLELLKIDL